LILTAERVVVFVCVQTILARRSGQVKRGTAGDRGPAMSWPAVAATAPMAHQPQQIRAIAHAAEEGTLDV
jgi:hypothetical protein